MSIANLFSSGKNDKNLFADNLTLRDANFSIIEKANILIDESVSTSVSNVGSKIGIIQIENLPAINPTLGLTFTVTFADANWEPSPVFLTSDINNDGIQNTKLMVCAQGSSQGQFTFRITNISGGAYNQIADLFVNYWSIGKFV